MLRIPRASLLVLAILASLGVLLTPRLGWSQTTTFEEVCARATTVNCWDFETEGDLYYTWPKGGICDQDPFLRNHPNGNNPFGLDRNGPGNTTAKEHPLAGICSYPKRDNQHASSGNFSLRFTYPSLTDSNPSGNFNPTFKRVGTRFAQFGAGGEFWVRFSMRESPDLLNTLIANEGGNWAGGSWQSGKNYKTNDLVESWEGTMGHRRFYKAIADHVSSGSDEPGAGSNWQSRWKEHPNFGGIKRLIVHGRSSSSHLEETIVDGFQKRIPQMYSNHGQEGYGTQDAIGCRLNKDTDPASFHSTVNYPEPPCKRFKPNVWRSWQVHVIVADNAPDYDNGVVELYLDDEPDPIIRVTDSEMRGLTQLQPYTENADWETTNGYGNLTFTLFSTNKLETQVHPEAYMWIDDVIVSKVRVPPLAGTGKGDSIAPAAPGDLVTD